MTNLQENDGSFDVVLVIEEWLLTRLSHRLQTRKVHDRTELVLKIFKRHL